jgi:hypothetical protein
MSPADRSDISNGIWVCQNCGKQIDDDEIAFSRETLRGLKSEAENSARDALPGELARHLGDGEFDVLAEAYRVLENSANWRASDYEKHHFYCTNSPAFTIAEGEELQPEFSQAWTRTFPDQSARSYRMRIFWHGTPIHSVTFVACDGMRFQLPLPQSDGEGGWSLRRDSIAYRIARLLDQYLPLDGTLQRCGIALLEPDPARRSL